MGVLFLLVSCSRVEKESEIYVNVVDVKRIKSVRINEKVTVQCLDIYEESLKNIFQELENNGFRVYSASCFSPRFQRNKNVPSIHAYASAIDVNPLQNPYFDAKTKILIPMGKYSEINGDRFLNRNKIRDGMLTEKEADIFAKYGFTVWGGMWLSPIDFMHFQTTRAIAKIVTSLPTEEAAVFWKAYLRDPKKISSDPFFSKDIKDKDIILEDLVRKTDEIITEK